MRKRDLGILIICAFAILWSFRGEAGGYYFTESWNQPLDTTLYSNLHYPTQSEKLPKPLITDLDGDGQNEVVYATRDCTLKVIEISPGTMGTKATPTAKAQTSLLRKVGVRSGRRPVALASGYLKSSTTQEEKQVIVVVTDGWIVMCYDHKLELLWESIPVDEVPEGYYHEEVAILIAPHPVRVGDEGIVVVGGRLVSEGGQINMEHEHATSHIGPDEKVEREGEGNHFSYFAFDGKSGGLRWKHEEGDFFSEDPHEHEGEGDADVETFMPSHSYKQHVFSQSRHLGEVDWRTYKHHVLTHLPFRWVDGFDSSFALDRFTKKTNSGREKSSGNSAQEIAWNTEAIGIPNPLGSSDPLATNQLFPKRDVDKPNVIVAKVKSGLEVVHLFTGRPLCRLLLPSLHAALSEGSYADINGDEVIDQIVASVNEPEATDVHGMRCLAVATTGLPPIEELWNGTICRLGMAFEMLMLRGLKISTQMSTTPPSFLPSTTTLGLNSIFMVSSGRITAYGPDGDSLWDVESRANWRATDYPVLTPVHIFPNDPALHLIALGTSLSLISPTGELLSTLRLRKATQHHDEAPAEGAGGDTGTGVAGGPRAGEIWSVAPPTLGDFNNDGLADVLVVGHDGLYGYAIVRGAGSVLFPGLVVVLICVMVYALVRTESTQGADARRGGVARKRALD